MTGFKTKKTKSIVLIWFSLFISGLLFGGNPMSNEQNQKNIFVMSQGDKTPITVKAPGEFSIKIESNPTTGYSWALQPLTEKEKSLVKFKKQKVEEPGDDFRKQKPLGAPTYEIFTFEALAPGEVVIQLHYRRPWEKDVPPIKKHKVIVTIE
jgi:inhibitor of cysteine peptidase